MQYSFAAEYHGPPVAYDLPRAVPIDVETIPVAAVVTQVPLANKFALPVVQPILPPAADLSGKKFSKNPDTRGSDAGVSPTSVIAFEKPNHQQECVSAELVLDSKPTGSPNSVMAFEEGRDADGRECVLSGELSSMGALEPLNERGESSESSGVINTTALELGSCSSVVQVHSHELLEEAGSSGVLDYSGSFVKSGEYTRSTGYPSSRVSSFKAEDCSNGPSCDGRRIQAAASCHVDSESDESAVEELSPEEAMAIQTKKEPEFKPRKGACYRCLKGNVFTEKEVCIVCDAKYCVNCVLRAMGSMPEGRKCVTCIGYTIDESKRGHLGKCSRMLKRLLNTLEVRQIMKAEKFCEVNQLPPEYVYVNGLPLSQEELVMLQSCSSPPKKLKPGNYWYDKVSGLWGKGGQKPLQVISPHLNVGGPLEADASNGNTHVFMNGREITKVELRMLQLSGVQCAGNPHFWVNDDGSYTEEGQKNTKGYIWGKAGTKLVCAILSLPVPSRSAASSIEQTNSLFNRTIPDYFEQKALQKLLLVGCDGSGTSTIFKQAKILYKDVPFSEDERESIKLSIQSNVYGYLGILLEGRERFEEHSLTEINKKQSPDTSSLIGNNDQNRNKTIYSISPKLKAFSDGLLKAMACGNLEAIFPAANREYAPLIEELWSDAAIQATYKRRSEIEMLPSVAMYFLERTTDILRPDYEPSDMDILYAEGVTASNGLSCVDFSFPQFGPDDNNDSADQNDSLPRYQLIRLQAKGLGENCKWLEMFEDVQIVIFCVSLSDYDQVTTDGSGAVNNKMMLAKKLFESIVGHPTFCQMNFLLVLNKFDLFEEKVERIPLNHCQWFQDFHPIISSHRSSANGGGINGSPSQGQLGFHYIAVKFKRLYTSLTGRKLYVSQVNGLGPQSVDAALRYTREIIKWDDEKLNFSLSENSIYSTSSFSP